MDQRGYHEAAFTLQELINLSNDIEGQVCRILGMIPSDYRALALLARTGPTSVGQLAELTGATSATTTAMVTRLERRGYIQRHREHVDRRVVHVCVDPAGQGRILGLLRPLMEGPNDALWDLPAHDQQVVTQFADLVRDHMNTHLRSLTAMERS